MTTKIRKLITTALAFVALTAGLQVVNPAPAQALNGTVINHCSAVSKQAVSYWYSNSKTYRDFLTCGEGDSGVAWFMSPKSFFVQSSSGIRHTYPAGTYFHTVPGVTYYVTSNVR